MAINNWIQAFRLRTLPLALSSIITGSFVAHAHDHFSVEIFVWAIVTTILLQITSNLANDYGDSQKGTDNDQRTGPKRAVQSGSVTSRQMGKAVLIFSILSLTSGIFLLYTAFEAFSILFIIMLIVGLLAIVAAIKYTVGKGAYGYHGWGDFFVLIFFGGAGVAGSYFIQTHYIDFKIIFPALSIGLLSAAVLNLNNMRDVNNDRDSGKKTLVVKMGFNAAKKYHAFLILASFFTTIFIAYFEQTYTANSFYLLGVPYLILIPHLLKIMRTNNPKLYDPELKKVALSTLLTAFCIALHLYYA